MIAFWISKGVALFFRGVEKKSSNLVRATVYGSSKSMPKTGTATTASKKKVLYVSLPCVRLLTAILPEQYLPTCIEN